MDAALAESKMILKININRYNSDIEVLSRDNGLKWIEMLSRDNGLKWIEMLSNG